MTKERARPRLPALVAPDSFKGTLAAETVAGAIARGLREAAVESVELPLADGGEGTARVLVRALGGRWVDARVSDPLGRPRQVSFALLADDRTAVVEVAAAAGLPLLAPAERDPLRASSRGVGELIAAAVRAGARRVLVAAGGSATVDGGAGALAALEEHAVDCELVVLCDVRTPWERAARTYGPQKGARPEHVPLLEERLDELAERAPRDPRGEPYTGAAGGLAGALWSWYGARLVAGAPYVLDSVGFDQQLRACWFVVTGEGKLDRQTLEGKVVAEVATRARQRGVACHAICGACELGAFDLRLLDLQGVASAGTPEDLARAARQLVEREHPCNGFDRGAPRAQARG